MGREPDRVAACQDDSEPSEHAVMHRAASHSGIQGACRHFGQLDRQKPVRSKPYELKIIANESETNRPTNQPKIITPVVETE